MDRNRTVAGLDVHKDNIYLSIMQQGGAIIFEKIYGTLTPELRQMCVDMLERGVTEAAMESTAVYWIPVWNELCGSIAFKTKEKAVATMITTALFLIYCLTWA